MNDLTALLRNYSVVCHLSLREVQGSWFAVLNSPEPFLSSTPNRGRTGISCLRNKPPKPLVRQEHIKKSINKLYTLIELLLDVLERINYNMVGPYIQHLLVYIYLWLLQVSLKNKIEILQVISTSYPTNVVNRLSRKIFQFYKWVWMELYHLFLGKFYYHKLHTHKIAL